MLISFGLILFIGYILGNFSLKLKLPSLVGMMIGGILLGPFAFDLLSQQVMDISSDIRSIALIVILIRCGLALDINKIKKVGVSAILLSFIPATVEIMAVVFLGQKFLGLQLIEAFILGTVLAAVSPAVIIPRMLKIQKEGYGKDRHVPELVMIGSSMDDIFVLILFSTGISFYIDYNFSLIQIGKIPVAIILGGLVGGLVGKLFVYLFKKYSFSDTVKVILLLSFSFIFYGGQDYINRFLPISSLVSIIVMGVVIFNCYKKLAIRLSERFRKLWVVAEIFLFVLVGATVDVKLLIDGWGVGLFVISMALAFRIVTVQLCLINTSFNKKEKLFIGISYIPKATVQAAIGAIPLSLGVENGDTILVIAVVAIMFTAPLGGFLIDSLYNKLLEKL